MRFWGSFFLTDHPVLAGIWVPLVGPVVAVVSFVCSIGNVPLVAVLWNGGISFGGVVAFIFANLIILPILNIYRKYYGARMPACIAATFYATMVLAGYAVETGFQPAAPRPHPPQRPGHRGPHCLELHHLAQHGLPRPGGGTPRAVLHQRRPAHAGHDGRQPGWGPPRPPRQSRATTTRETSMQGMRPAAGTGWRGRIGTWAETTAERAHLACGRPVPEPTH